MWYHVTVRQDRDQFYIQAPAFGRSRFVDSEPRFADTKEAIERAAFEMVAQCGASANKFTLVFEWELQAVRTAQRDFRNAG